jgi:hypothetical protein
VDVGIKRGNVYLGTRHFPDRKHASLVVEVGNSAIVIGTIRDEETWVKAVEALFNQDKMSSEVNLRSPL